MEHAEIVAEQATRVGTALDAYEAAVNRRFWNGFRSDAGKTWCSCPSPDRVDRRRGRAAAHHDDAERTHTITYRLKDLEQRLDPTIHSPWTGHAREHRPHHQSRRHARRHARSNAEQRPKSPSQPFAIANVADTIPETLNMMRTLRVAIPVVVVWLFLFPFGARPRAVGKARVTALAVTERSVRDGIERSHGSQRATPTPELVDDTLIAGRAHERFDQYDNGVRVFGGNSVRQMAGDQAVSVRFSQLHPDISLDRTPRLSRDDVTARV